MNTSTWSADARARLADYLDGARAWAGRQHDLDPDALVDELAAHVACAFADRVHAPTVDDLQVVLDSLGDPGAWEAASHGAGAGREDLARFSGARAEVGVATLFWGGLLLTGALAMPPLLPLMAYFLACVLVHRARPAGAARSTWLLPPLLAGECLAWGLAAVLPAFLLLAFVTEGSPAGLAFGGGSPGVGMALAGAALTGILALACGLCARRPACMRRLLPVTGAPAARVPRLPLACASALMALVATVLRLQVG